MVGSHIHGFVNIIFVVYLEFLTDEYLQNDSSPGESAEKSLHKCAILRGQILLDKSRAALKSVEYARNR